MTNNDTLKKLRVALMLRDDDIVEILKLVDFKITTSELGAFFRKEDHPKYMECGDQILRNFLNGLVIYLRGSKDNPSTPAEALAKKGKTSLPKKKIYANNKPKPIYKDKVREKNKSQDLSSVKYKNKKK
ncbi:MULTISPECIES: DUF1456 family protein [unclassified Cellulophaga]|uniref:DUF1456 family protein n=1 Tax=unclassified Cellulophaga TaxID=2634405 RepID=UPI0026E334C6|nr:MULTISPECIES: DUF1456 family protein [unclassified Cellulophaga]MDO6492174.1 DUF1456 family protein [Cellulophaga sp. 2_MG-2023]MDO6495665.1 DUF1456 family protein [Cellulophaga sp. 3_MG-2023]